MSLQRPFPFPGPIIIRPKCHSEKYLSLSSSPEWHFTYPYRWMHWTGLLSMLNTHQIECGMLDSQWQHNIVSKSDTYTRKTKVCVCTTYKFWILCTIIIIYAWVGPAIVRKLALRASLVYKGDKSLGLEFSSILTRLKAGLRSSPDKFCGIF